jgi:osmotically-inducible protein OsmY
MKHLLLALTLSAALLTGCRTNETPAAQVNDMEITASVKSKLASDVGLSTLPDIAVNSTNGVVTLSGAVDSAGTKAKAETIARSVPKVTRVVNNLQIAPKPGSN